jgi:hypothetical protein
MTATQIAASVKTTGAAKRLMTAPEEWCPARGTGSRRTRPTPDPHAVARAVAGIGQRC